MIKTKKENPFFPIELSSIVKIGEQTGNLSWLLVKIWIKFDKELDRVVKNIQTAIEPVVIIWVGLVIGTIILAIMLPFFNMVNVI
jgi:type IV pilus assembly protein PilC